MNLRLFGITYYFNRADLLLIMTFILLSLLLYLYFKKPDGSIDGSIDDSVDGSTDGSN